MNAAHVLCVNWRYWSIFLCNLYKSAEYLQCKEIILSCELYFTTLTALQILETSCSDRASRGTGCWSKKFLCNRSRSHTPFQLWVPLWASLRLLTAENANCSQMEVKNVIKWDKHLGFLLEGFEVSAIVILYISILTFKYNKWRLKTKYAYILCTYVAEHWAFVEIGFDDVVWAGLLMCAMKNTHTHSCLCVWFLTLPFKLTD